MAAFHQNTASYVYKLCIFKTVTHKLYFIPGVATDARVFAGLDLPDYEKVYLNWKKPRKGEPIQEYAARFAEQIDFSANPVLIGYSFGGIMAIEIAKQHPVEAVILVSSIKHYHERPVAMALTSGFSLNRLFPAEFGKNFRFAYAWLNDPRTPDEHVFIDKMAADMDPDHTDWAIHHALSWRNADPLETKLYHIHGDQDRIFPIRYIRNCIRIKGGSHLMLLNKPDEISRHINRIVKSLPPQDRRRMA